MAALKASEEAEHEASPTMGYRKIPEPRVRKTVIPEKKALPSQETRKLIWKK
jgi:hypothetical protein